MPPGGSVLLDDGSIAASGGVTVSSGASMTWARAKILGTGTTRIAAGATLLVTGAVAFDEQRRLVNEGTVTLRGPVRATGGEIVNTGLLTLEGAAAIKRTWGACALVRSTGRLTKAGAGTATLAGVLQLGGEAEVGAGTLLLHSATPQTAGAAVTAAPDATLEVYTSSLQWTAGRLSGGGSLRLTNMSTVTLPPQVTLGTLDVAGNMVVAAPLTVSLLISRAGAVCGPGDVTVTGSLLLDDGALSARAP